MAVTIGKLVGSAPSGATLPADAFPLGPFYGAFRTITFDSAYTSGGEALAPDTVGFNKIYAIAVLSSNSSAVEARYDVADEVLIVSPSQLESYSTVTALEHTDLTGYTITVLVVGR